MREGSEKVQDIYTAIGCSHPTVTVCWSSLLAR